MTTRTRIEILASRFDGKRDFEADSYYGPNVDPTRSDQYAENMIGKGNYRDTGCKLAPRCLECPFDECVMETEGEASQRRGARNIVIWNNYRKYKRAAKRSPGSRPRIVERLAREHDLSTRSVHRVLTNARKGIGLGSIVPPVKVDTHELLTGGIFKQRAPWPQIGAKL